MDFVNSDFWQQLFVLPGDHITWWAEVIRSVLRVVIGLVMFLAAVPILVWGERRLLALLQGRLGPNRVGPQGLLQPLADALKLMMKEDIIPTNVDKVLYILAPGVALAPIVLSITVIPWNGSRDWGAVAPRLDIGILFVLAAASIEVYGVITAGWSSNNKYSLLGGLRASSQVISYELGMGLAVLAVLLMSGTLAMQNLVMGYDAIHPFAHNLAPGLELSNGQGLVYVEPIAGSNYTVFQHDWKSGFWDWNVLKLFPFGLIAAGVYMISMIAETNRAPFDLPEAETELVAGFHTEYSSFKFAMFFMGEYANMMIVSAICTTLFFGGWLAPWGLIGQIPASAGGIIPDWFISWFNAFWSIGWFMGKTFGLVALIILVRATFPRLRYDMLMRFGWKGLLPVALTNLVLIAVSLGFQEYFRESGSVAAWWAGQLIAWALMGAILGTLFVIRMRSYHADKRTGRPAGGTGVQDPLPIRRGSVIVALPPAPVGDGQ